MYKALYPYCVVVTYLECDVLTSKFTIRKATELPIQKYLWIWISWNLLPLITRGIVYGLDDERKEYHGEDEAEVECRAF